MMLITRKYDCSPVDLAFVVKPTLSQRLRRFFDKIAEAMDTTPSNFLIDAAFLLF